mmetsp:Transcript_96369/g.181292  ORF Transcript_96369/g.181292 Transcript_96369/m.181292 type:complete len:307 (-) Transcript_96369:2497-3417(-)
MSSEVASVAIPKTPVGQLVKESPDALGYGRPASLRAMSACWSSNSLASSSSSFSNKLRRVRSKAFFFTESSKRNATVLASAALESMELQVLTSVEEAQLFGMVASRGFDATAATAAFSTARSSCLARLRNSSRSERKAVMVLLASTSCVPTFPRSPLLSGPVCFGGLLLPLSCSRSGNGTPLGTTKWVSMRPFPFTSIAPRLTMVASGSSAPPKPSRAAWEIWMQPGIPLDSMRLDTFTVSPKKQKRGTFCPTTPVNAGPECTPTRICRRILGGGRTLLTASSIDRPMSITRFAWSVDPSCPAATI